MQHKNTRRASTTKGKKKTSSPGSTLKRVGIGAIVIALGALLVIQQKSTELTPESQVWGSHILASLFIYATWVGGLLVLLLAAYVYGKEQGKPGYIKPLGQVLSKVFFIVFLPATVLTVATLAIVGLV